MIDSREDMERVQRCLDTLGEHFDSVQVFTTRYDPAVAQGTIRVYLGCGNWYARYGQVKEWVLREEENSRSQIRDGQEGGV